MAAPRLRRCANTQELERVVDDLAIQGYKIKNRSETAALLQKTEYGSVGVHIVLFLFTFGIGNIIYLLVKLSGGDQIAVKVSE